MDITGSGVVLTDKRQDTIDHTVISAESISLKGPSDTAIEPNDAKISFEKLQTRVTAGLLRCELNFKIGLDSAVYFVFF